MSRDGNAPPRRPAERRHPFVIPSWLTSTPLAPRHSWPRSPSLRSDRFTPTSSCIPLRRAAPAGLIAGCTLLRAGPHRVIGIRADESSSVRSKRDVRAIIQAWRASRLRVRPLCRGAHRDRRRVRRIGLRCATVESRDAIELTARTEACSRSHLHGEGNGVASSPAFVVARSRRRTTTVLFWHKGGQVALFA